MIKPKLYLDTTIPSAFLDERAIDRQRLTQQFWQVRLNDFEPLLSTVTIREIEDTPDERIRAAMLNLVTSFEVLDVEEEALALAAEYVARGIFPERYASDAMHVAIAVTNGITYLASWNFTHLVKVATRREVNLVNALLGYGTIEIVAPPEL
jgi:hypothetical protein